MRMVREASPQVPGSWANRDTHTPCPRSTTALGDCRRRRHHSRAWCPRARPGTAAVLRGRTPPAGRRRRRDGRPCGNRERWGGGGREGGACVCLEHRGQGGDAVGAEGRPCRDGLGRRWSVLQLPSLWRGDCARWPRLQHKHHAARHGAVHARRQHARLRMHNPACSHVVPHPTPTTRSPVEVEEVDVAGQPLGQHVAGDGLAVGALVVVGLRAWGAAECTTLSHGGAPWLRLACLHCRAPPASRHALVNVVAACLCNICMPHTSCSVCPSP